MSGDDLQAWLAQAREAVGDSETVTRARSRDVELRAGTMALITLDNGEDHTRPNTFGPHGLTELHAALTTALARDDVIAIGVTGKPFILAAGADLTGVAHLRGPADAAAIARIGHGVFRLLRDGGKPSFCFINGAALGGGLELALHCDYRTVLDSVTAIATPEVMLGLVPGWGGCYLLPNLIGPEAAVRMIVDNPHERNRMLNGRQALELGLADVAFDGAAYLARSLSWADRVLTGEIEVTRPEPDRGGGWDAAVAEGRGRVDERLHGAAPAPYRALDLIAAARTATRDEAFAAEDEALTELLMTPQLRAGLYAFDLVQRRARRPSGAPNPGLAREIRKVGVVGAGLMARQLAMLFARRLEVPVVMTDVDEERVASGVAAVHAEIDALQAAGRADERRANRWRALVTGGVDLDGFADADLVIEAVFEEMTVKKEVLGRLEEVVAPEAILATNTSALSVSEMAADLAHPERVVGLHFFNPVAVLPLLEVVRADETSDVTLATALSVARRLRKSAVIVKDSPGFVVNRVLSRLLGEVTRAVDAGMPPETADAALDPLGLPMRPLTLLQLVGPQVALHVAETLHETLGDRFHVGETLRGGGSPRPGAVAGGAGSADDLRERALSALADEIGLLLDEGVVAAAADVDLCMLLGAGWPFHLGGITPYLDATGVSARVLGHPLAR